MKQRILDAMQDLIIQNGNAIDEAYSCDPIDNLHVSNLMNIQKGMLEMQIAVLKSMLYSD